MAEAPLQIVALFTVTTKEEATVTVSPIESVQEPVVPTKVYEVVAVGLATTDAPDVLLKPVPGCQLYVVAPDALSATVAPGQIVGLFTDNVGVGFTVTVAVLLPEHPVEVPVTVYTVVEVGLAFTEDPVVALNPVEGVQLYVVPPAAVSVAFPPEQ